MRASPTTSRLLLLLTLVPAGCRRTASTPQTHAVAIRSFEFQPAALNVHPGETIRWKNSDAVPHTVTDSNNAFDSDSIAPGNTWSYVATRPGTYHYVCSLHPNMEGTLVVQ